MEDIGIRGKPFLKQDNRKRERNKLKKVPRTFLRKKKNGERCIKKLS